MVHSLRIEEQSSKENFSLQSFSPHRTFFLGDGVVENSSSENPDPVLKTHLDFITSNGITIMKSRTDHAANLTENFCRNAIECFNFPRQPCTAHTVQLPLFDEFRNGEACDNIQERLSSYSILPNRILGSSSLSTSIIRNKVE
jgi:hypothetical protein